ncbi:MAG: 3'(2'),5'-bisphosphate nucleotidase [Planctomycetota bacterium]
MPTQNPKLLEAVRCVQIACRAARQVQADLDRVRSITKDDRSPVTVADYAVQALVALELQRRLGVDPIVGEEHSAALRNDDNAAVRSAVVEAVSAHIDATEDEVLDAIDAGSHDGSASGYWTIDPIDGTKGFLRGQQYAIALGWIENGAVVHGIMGSPNLPVSFDASLADADPTGTIYAASRGVGAWWCPSDADFATAAPLHAGPEPALDDIVVCESVEAAHSDQSASQKLVASLGGTGSPLRLDSQCKYAVVARGQAHAYLRLPTRQGYVEKIWDHAAGSIIATESGAIVTDVAGNPLDFGHGRRLEQNKGVVCANAGLHGKLIEAIARLHAERAKAT